MEFLCFLSATGFGPHLTGSQSHKLVVIVQLRGCQQQRSFATQCPPIYALQSGPVPTMS